MIGVRLTYKNQEKCEFVLYPWMGTSEEMESLNRYQKYYKYEIFRESNDPEVYDRICQALGEIYDFNLDMVERIPTWINPNKEKPIQFLAESETDRFEIDILLEPTDPGYNSGSTHFSVTYEYYEKVTNRSTYGDLDMGFVMDRSEGPRMAPIYFDKLVNSIIDLPMSGYDTSSLLYDPDNTTKQVIVAGKVA